MASQGHRNSATSTEYARRANTQQSLPVAFAYDPKLEFDDQEDALAEPDSASPHDSSGPSLPTRQNLKTEAEAAPNTGTGPKRKRPLKLTASQRERKRAIDREAQRSIRIKTKNYIAHLESLVKVMEETDATGPDGENNRTREVMSQLRQSQEEVRRLRETMLGVQRLLGGVLSDGMSERGFQHQGSASASPPSASEGHIANSFSRPSAATGESASGWLMPKQSNEHSSTSTETIHPTRSHQEIPPRPDADPRKRKVPGEMFFYAEWHLNRVHAAGATAFGNQPFDEDIVVRAIIEGWPAVEDRYELDLAWQVLREVDQVVFSESGVVERIAVMRLMRMRLLYQTNNRASNPIILPPHMTQEVADLGKHADIIDHFVWPGFRHAVIERPEKYITNHINEKYRRCLKFLWPYEITDTYVKNPMTQLYECTPEFAQRQVDIRCWTMKRQFFEGCEELLPVIPAFEVTLTKALPPPRTRAFIEQPRMGIAETHEVREQELDLEHPGPIVVAGAAPGVNVQRLGAPQVQHAVDMAQWHHPHPVPSHGRRQPAPQHQHDQYWQGDPGVDVVYDGMESQGGNEYPM